MTIESRLSYRGGESGPVAIRGDFGEHVLDVESLAFNHEPFAVRLRPFRSEVAPGVAFSACSIELGGDRFTNSFELTVDVDRAAVAVCTDPGGFHLPDLIGGRTVAAVSGSFSFISDQPDYQPAEPCLDFCCRDGATVSLPTAAKPAFLVHRGRPRLRDLDPRGTLAIAGRDFAWVGSKVAAAPGDADSLVVYGAANCRVGYSRAPRVGLLREVERESNTTPREPGIVDLVVRRAADGGFVVSAVRPGGGVDLFEGSYVLRGPGALAEEVRVGDPVRVRSVDGLDCADLSSGTSIGPSLEDARCGRTAAHDASLGTSPFTEGRRYARTVVSLDEGRLRFRVLDAAPMTGWFQGVTSVEAAQVLAADGVDPVAAHHLDGGQSSKVAVWEDGTTAVFGSMHYMLWPKTAESPLLWRGFQGRRLRSAFRVLSGTG